MLWKKKTKETAAFFMAAILLMANVAAANDPPVADAGPDQNIYLGEQTILQGWATDPNNDPVIFWEWTIVSAPAGSSPYLSSPYRYNPVFIPDMPGDYVLSLVAADIWLNYSLPDTVVIHVAQSNQPPVADAGPDQNIYLGDLSYLQGSAMDPDNDPIISWEWTIESAPDGSSPSLVNPYYPNTIFIPDMVGDYILSLVVTDGLFYSLADTVVIHVAQNLPPVAVINADVTSGDAPLQVNFDGTQSFDPEGGQISYFWIFGDGPTTSREPSPSHLYSKSGSYQVALIVTDNLQLDKAFLKIDVTHVGNNPPVVSPSATPRSGIAPLFVQFMANASDPDGDPLSYMWIFGDGSTSTAPNPAHTYAGAGAYVAWLTVSDGELAVSESLTIVVDPPMYLSVNSASVKWTKNGADVGNIHLDAAMDIFQPNRDDLIVLKFDGITLFAAPFSDFVPTGDQGSVIYQLKDKNLLVKMDVDAGWLWVIRHKMDISSVNNLNGVDVKLQVGDAVGIENILMSEAPGRKLTYIHPQW